MTEKHRDSQPKVATRRKPRFPHIVCKPCWELKYCPYGPLVEFFPSISEEDPIPLEQIEKSYSSWMSAAIEGRLKTPERVYEAIEKILCLEPKRWAAISQYRTDELWCSVFGHLCPVFFTAEPFTETKQGRETGRRIPREVMLKVIRRDGQVCANCRINVPDDQIEFDHIIPVARGGATTAENLRVLCRPCNRSKSDDAPPIL